MPTLTLKQAALLPLALFTLACNPFAVQLPEPEGFTPQRPAAALDLPITESGSAQASLDDSASTDCDHVAPRNHSNHGPHRN